MQDLEHYQGIFQKGPDAMDMDSSESALSGVSTSGSASQWRKQLLQKVQSALIASLEIGDEKVQIVQTMQEEVENKSRQLEANCKSLDFKDQDSADVKESGAGSRDGGTGAGGSSSGGGGNAGSGGERQSKRARRIRTDTAGITTHVSNGSLEPMIDVKVASIMPIGEYVVTLQ